MPPALPEAIETFFGGFPPSLRARQQEANLWLETSFLALYSGTRLCCAGAPEAQNADEAKDNLEKKSLTKKANWELQRDSCLLLGTFKLCLETASSRHAGNCQKGLRRYNTPNPAGSGQAPNSHSKWRQHTL